MSECCLDCGPANPAYIHTVVTEIFDAVRYELFPDSCYVLSAKLVSSVGQANFVAHLLSTQFPDVVGGEPGEEDKLWSLSVGGDFEPDLNTFTPGLYAPHGLYADGVGLTGTDTAHLVVQFIKRSEYCCAFGSPQESLEDCWNGAAGRAGTPLWSNFDRGEEGNLPWANSGTGGTGPGGSVIFTDSTFRIGDDGDATAQIAFEAGNIPIATTYTITVEGDVTLSDSGISASYQNINPSPLSSAMQIGTDTSVGEMTPALVKATYYSEQAGAPSSTPGALGLFNMNTSNGDLYKSTGTSSSTDWVLVGTMDHGTLGGLADDDHTQYHNDSRATTWLAGRQATTTQIGVAELATTLEAETGADTLRALTPASIANLIARLPKLYGVLQTNGTGSPTLESNSYNLASVSRTGTGLYTFTFSGGIGLTADAYTAVLSEGISTSAQFFVAEILTRTSAVVTIEIRNATTLALADGGDWSLTVHANI